VTKKELKESNLAIQSKKFTKKDAKASLNDAKENSRDAKLK